MSREIQKLIEDLERLENGNRLGAAQITGNLRWQVIHRERYLAKADAYRFIKRKIKRQFKIKQP